jgi:holo-[acyl-carrier protein] synthase
LRIVGSGVDLAEVERIRQAVERHGERFLRRVFTPGERAYVERKKNRYERYAARFAAKEAGMKAIGTGWKRGVTWQDFEVVNEPLGRPVMRLSGRAAEIASDQGVRAVSLSLSHTGSLAIAHVILEA